MNKQIKALKMAIEALEDFSAQYANLEPIINSCKEALEQQAQEPVAWMYETDGGAVKLSCYREGHQGGGKIRNYNETPLYTHPAQDETSSSQQARLVPLSDDEICKIYEDIRWDIRGTDIVIDFARAIEQAHGIGVKDE